MQPIQVDEKISTSSTNKNNYRCDRPKSKSESFKRSKSIPGHAKINTNIDPGSMISTVI